MQNWPEFDADAWGGEELRVEPGAEIRRREGKRPRPMSRRASTDSVQPVDMAHILPSPPRQHLSMHALLRTCFHMKSLPQPLLHFFLLLRLESQLHQALKELSYNLIYADFSESPVLGSFITSKPQRLSSYIKFLPHVACRPYC